MNSAFLKTVNCVCVFIFFYPLLIVVNKILFFIAWRNCNSMRFLPFDKCILSYFFYLSIKILTYLRKQSMSIYVILRRFFLCSISHNLTNLFFWVIIIFYPFGRRVILSSGAFF